MALEENTTNYTPPWKKSRLIMRMAMLLIAVSLLVIIMYTLGSPSPSMISAIAELLASLQWPLVAIIILTVFTSEIRTFIGRIRSGTILGTHFTLSEELETANRQVRQMTQEEPTEVERATGLLQNSDHLGREKTTEDIIREVLRVAGTSPQAAVMLIGSEIESLMRWTAANAEYQLRPNASVREIGRAMLDQGVISNATWEALNSFWDIRNKIVHQSPGSDWETLATVDIGAIILRQLRASL